jgi:serine O-acetyltransferase
MPDPLADAIHALLDHLKAVDTKIETMADSLAKLDKSFHSDALPTLADKDEL